MTLSKYTAIIHKLVSLRRANFRELKNNKAWKQFIQFTLYCIKNFTLSLKFRLRTLRITSSNVGYDNAILEQNQYVFFSTFESIKKRANISQMW